MTTTPHDSQTPTEIAADLPGFDQIPTRGPDDPELVTTETEPMIPPASPSRANPPSTRGRLMGSVPPALDVDDDRDEPSWASSATTSTDRGSSPASTDDDGINPEPLDFANIYAMAISGLGLGMHRAFSRHARSQVWLPTDEEVNGIAAPLSRITARHVRLADTKQVGDVVDVVEIAVVTAGYVIRNLDELARQPEVLDDPWAGQAEANQ